MAKAKKAKIDAGDVDLARQKIKVGELLAQDRQKLLMRMPFIGALLMRLDLVPVRDERLDTAATDGDRIYVDIDFYMKLKSDERLFVLAHEAWHCALIHFMRRGDRNKEQFNIAADLEIHFILTDEGFKAPFVLPHDPRWKGLSGFRRRHRSRRWPAAEEVRGGSLVLECLKERNPRTSRGRGTDRVSTSIWRRGITTAIRKVILNLARGVTRIIRQK